MLHFILEMKFLNVVQAQKIAKIIFKKMLFVWDI